MYKCYQNEDGDDNCWVVTHTNIDSISKSEKNEPVGDGWDFKVQPQRILSQANTQLMLNTTDVPTAHNLVPDNNKKKTKNTDKKKKDLFPYLKDAYAFVAGGYAPHRPVKVASLPVIGDVRVCGPLSVLMNYAEMKNVDEWEEENERRSKVVRERLDAAKQNSVTRPLANMYEYVMENNKVRELAFPSNSHIHLAAAVENGLKVDKDKNNLASVAQKYASEIDNYFIADGKGKEGERSLSNLRNALRHTIWQANIASRYNLQVAYDAAASHERFPYADTSIRVFDNETDADMTVDLLNNRIGRKIGADNPDLGRKELALLALKELWQNGLYNYERGKDGKWHVSLVRISNDVYNKMYDTYMKLDDNAM